MANHSRSRSYSDWRRNLAQRVVSFTLLAVSLITLSGCPDKLPVRPLPEIPDSSLSWTLRRISSPTQMHINAIDIRGSNIVFGGEEGLIYSGTPGGMYHIANLPLSTAVWVIRHVNDRMYAFCDQGTVFSSTDYEVWSTVYTGQPNMRFHTAAVDGMGRIWAAGSNIGVIVSADEGATWARYTNIGGTVFSSATAIGFHPASQRGILMGTTHAFRSVDNGNSWNGTLALPSVPRCVYFDSSNELLVGCDDGAILRSFDFGATWQATSIESVQFETVNKILQVNQQNYLAITSYLLTVGTEVERHGRVWASNDRQNWRLIADLPNEMRDITMESGVGIFVCGTDGYLGTLYRD